MQPFQITFARGRQASNALQVATPARVTAVTTGHTNDPKPRRISVWLGYGVVLLVCVGILFLVFQWRIRKHRGHGRKATQKTARLTPLGGNPAQAKRLGNAQKAALSFKDQDEKRALFYWLRPPKKYIALRKKRRVSTRSPLFRRPVVKRRIMVREKRPASPRARHFIRVIASPAYFHKYKMLTKATWISIRRTRIFFKKGQRKGTASIRVIPRYTHDSHYVCSFSVSSNIKTIQLRPLLAISSFKPLQRDYCLSASVYHSYANGP